MKILLAVADVFSSIGGGQRFFANQIHSQPEIDFYFFVGAPADALGLPSNAHALPLSDAYRHNAARFVPGGALSGKRYDLCCLLDMAAAASGMEFDVLDIPDYLAFGALLRECLAFHKTRVGKVTLSLHGTLSNVLEDSWNNEPSDMTLLMEYEELLYRYADARYGISQRYIEEWRDRTGHEAVLIHATLALPPATDDASAAASKGARSAVMPTSPPAAPDLCFVGRQEKCKGPDLFVEICASLPRASYGQVRLVGPGVDINGYTSEAALERLSRHRSLPLHFETVAPAEMATWLRTGRKIVVLPSRRDTFNLVAMEAVLAGCPLVLSIACGVCEYLDHVYPGLPHVRIDPDRLDASYDAIQDLLDNYDLRQAELRAYLDRSIPFTPPGSGLEEVYAGAHKGGADPLARQVVAAAFADAMPALLTGIAHVADELAGQCAERIEALSTGKLPSHWHRDYAKDQFRAACRLDELARRFSVEGGLKPALDSVQKERAWLDQQIHGGNRINLYELMAIWELHRGNELLFATYRLRALRLSGRYPPDQVDQVAEILSRHGYTEEARALKLIAGADAGAVHDYLRRRAAADYRTPAVEFPARCDHRDPAAPKVSVIVSVYNGADKIEVFLGNLERMSMRGKSIAEVIFVDSHSPDATEKVLTARLALAAGRGVRALYVRTPERETIQTAWNRGIDLARGDYLAFLGLDEKVRGDAFEIMADYLDRHAQVDWVQGSAVVTEVNPQGSYVRDVMLYNRSYAQQESHYLDGSGISYVGALYRKSIHTRFGYYDTRFRGAGDTEFKNRVLPFIHVVSLPETLGVFLNYPEERTTQSPMAELEDLRAWYLFRTEGGLRYGLDRRPAAVATQLFHLALRYRKSYMERWCSDVDLALVLGRYLAQRTPVAYVGIEQLMPGLESLQLAYRRFDELVPAGGMQGLERHYLQAGALEKVWYWADAARRSHRFFGADGEYWINNDNRWHQHHPLWASLPHQHHLEAAVDHGELRACRDLGDVLNACGSSSDEVDLERAWNTGRTGQLLRLMARDSLDVVLAPPLALTRDAGLALLALGERLAQGRAVSVVLAGFDASGWTRPERQAFITGRIATMRPLYAAAKIVAFPWQGQAAAAAVAQVVEALGHGKPVILSRDVLAALRKRYPALSFGLLPCFGDEAELSAACVALAGDAARRALLRGHAIDLARRMLDGGDLILPHAESYAPPAGLVEWGADAGTATAAGEAAAPVRADVGQGGAQTLRDLLQFDLVSRVGGKVRGPVSPSKLELLFKQLAHAHARGELEQPKWLYLFEPVSDLADGEGPRLQRIMAMVWQMRADLQLLYPLHETASQNGFVAWCLLAGSREYPALHACMNTATAAALERPAQGFASTSLWDKVFPSVLLLLRSWRPDLAGLFDPTQSMSRLHYLYWYLQGGREELGLRRYALPPELRKLLERMLSLEDSQSGTHGITGLMQLEYIARADLQHTFDMDTAAGIEAYIAWHGKHGVRLEDR